MKILTTRVPNYTQAGLLLLQYSNVCLSRQCASL